MKFMPKFKLANNSAANKCVRNSVIMGLNIHQRVRRPVGRHRDTVK